MRPLLRQLLDRYILQNIMRHLNLKAPVHFSEISCILKRKAICRHKLHRPAAYGAATEGKISNCVMQFKKAEKQAADISSTEQLFMDKLGKIKKASCDL